jgi:hypothetical protein
MRLLYLPWNHLTHEEQETAVREARRRGAWAVRSELRRYEGNGADPVPVARPLFYVRHLLPETPAPWARYWRRQPEHELCMDRRVCAFGDAWERARRSSLEEPAPPRDAPTLALHVMEAREAWAAARRDYRERVAALAQAAAPAGHPDRLASGVALIRLLRARDNFWMAMMLARAAGWKPPFPAWARRLEVNR